MLDRTTPLTLLGGLPTRAAIVDHLFWYCHGRRFVCRRGPKRAPSAQAAHGALPFGSIYSLHKNGTKNASKMAI